MVKRCTALVLALACLVALVSCGKKPGSSSQLPDSSSSQSSASGGGSSPESKPAPPYQKTDPAAINPLTGLPRPEGLEADARPVAVMVANNHNALPQRGLAAADVLYEMVTEGGITRLMALYGDYRAIPQVGPVRSTRDSFLQFALPLTAIPVHIGASIYGSNLLNLLGYKDVNGLYLGASAFYFDQARNQPQPGGKPIEYCWFTDAGLVWAGIEMVDIAVGGNTASQFLFSTAAPVAGTDAYSVNLVFSGASSAGFVYNEETGLYDKNIFDAPHTDEDGTRLSYTNVFALMAEVGLKEDGRSPEFDLSKGTGFYFNAGKVVPVTWSKGAPTDPLFLFTAEGAPLEVQPGKSYIGVLGTAAEPPVTYAPKPA